MALAAAVRSARLRDAMASTATPRLKTGRCNRGPRLPPVAQAAWRWPAPNPLVRVGDGGAIRLTCSCHGLPCSRAAAEAALRDRAAWTPAADPDQRRIASVKAGADWTEARLAGGEPLAVRRASPPTRR